jgi:phage N-6-adenine-methyltransferase
MNDKTALAQIGKLAKERRSAKTLNQVRLVMGKAKGLEELCKNIGAKLDIQNAAAEEHIRCQIIAGEMLRDGERQGSGRPKKPQHDVGVLPTVKEIGITSTTVSRWLKLANFDIEMRESVFAEIKHSGEEMTCALFIRTYEGNGNGKVDGDEWFTPKEYIVAAREVLGDIDLDPASCSDAQKIIKAARYYTKANNGLEQRWYGRIWLNPPFSFPAVEDFTTRARMAFEQHEIESAIVLTNNCADTGWFHRLFQGTRVCLTEGRINFWRPDRASTGNRQGQAFFYFGLDAAKFSEIFGKFGTIVQRVE